MTRSPIELSTDSAWTAKKNTLTSFQLDLLLKDASGGDTTSFVKNGEWDLIGSYQACDYQTFEILLLKSHIFLEDYENIILTMKSTSFAPHRILKCISGIYCCQFVLSSGLPGLKNIATYEYGSYVDITFTIHIR